MVDRTEKRFAPSLTTRIHSIAKVRIADYQTCFDFDNTLTDFDVLDAIIQRFAVNKEWVSFEEAWKSGRIGSRECLINQLKSVRARKEELSEYLAGIKIDPSFKRILEVLRQHGSEPAIVSDSFSFFIETILLNNGFKDITVYSNRIRFEGDRLIPSFPHANKECHLCGHCKKFSIYENGLMTKGKKIIYVGDGQSDVCPAEHADIVFAKASLWQHFKKIGKPAIEFSDLSTVYAFLGGFSDESKARTKSG